MRFENVFTLLKEYLRMMDLNSNKEVTLGEYKMALNLSSFSLLA